MKSKIKRFVVDPRDFPGAEMNSIGPDDFNKAETEMLKQFDEWREETKPTILGIEFGRKRGRFFVDDAFCCYLNVLYLEA